MKNRKFVGVVLLVAALVAIGLAPARLILAQDGDGPGLIVYASDRTGNYEIYTLDPQTGQREQLTDDPGTDIEPSWSPDGETIVFTSDRDGDFEVYVMRADGSELRQLTRNFAEDRMPRWQPNGEYIVFSSDLNGQWDLFAISADGALVRQLTNDEFDERGPVAEAGPGVEPTAQPGVPPATAIPTQPPMPDATVNAARLNLRQNPGEGATIITTMTRDTALDIVGRMNDNTWVQVVNPAGVTGWVYSPLLQINISLATVPVVPVQFIPPPPTATPTVTPIPATPVPATGVNLVAGIVVLEPASPTCAQTFNVGFDVANLGSQPTSIGGTVSLVDARAADGTVQATTVGSFPVLAPGQTYRVNIPLTISTWYNEVHRITLSIDPADQIPETDATDNNRTIEYVLAKGSCP
jgi:hypothetical protein